MLPRLIPTRLVGLSLALGAMQLSAQLIQPELKLRWGYGTTRMDHLNQWNMGFGANVGYKTRLGTVGVELGYAWKPGDTYLEPVRPLDPATGKSAINLAKSGDSRQNRMDGIMLRFTLKRAIPDTDLSWQAGVQLGGTRFRHQYMGNIRSADWAKPSTAAPAGTGWADVFLGSPTRATMGISPMAGIQWRTTPRSSLEVNLVVLNYKSIEYIHDPGKASAYVLEKNYDGTVAWGPIGSSFPASRLAEKTRFQPHIECGYVFHF